MLVSQLFCVGTYSIINRLLLLDKVLKYRDYFHLEHNIINKNVLKTKNK